MTHPVRLALLAVAFAVGTFAFGWWAVPVLGAVWGVVDRSSGVAGRTAALAAGVAWGAMLLSSGVDAPIALLAAKLGAVMQVPAAVLLAATVLFPALLAGSAAAVVGKIGTDRHG